MIFSDTDRSYTENKLVLRRSKRIVNVEITYHRSSEKVSQMIRIDVLFSFELDLLNVWTCKYFLELQDTLKAIRRY